MVKTITRTILTILLILAVWVGYQYYVKSPTAIKLAKEKIDEFYSTDLDTLSQKIGKGYEYKTIEINGQKFWMSWSFNKKEENTIEMNGRVDFIELLPFTEFRFGHTFNPRMELKYD